MPDPDSPETLPDSYASVLSSEKSSGEGIFQIGFLNTNAIDLTGGKDNDERAGVEAHGKWERKSDGSVTIAFDDPERIIRENVIPGRDGVLITTDQTLKSDFFLAFGPHGSIKLSNGFLETHIERQFDDLGRLTDRRMTSRAATGSERPEAYKSLEEHYRDGVLESSTFHSNWRTSNSTSLSGHVDRVEQHDENGLVSMTVASEESGSVRDASGQDVAISNTKNSDHQRSSDGSYSAHEYSRTKTGDKVTFEQDMNYTYVVADTQMVIASGTGVRTEADGVRKQINFDPMTKTWVAEDEKPAAEKAASQDQASNAGPYSLGRPAGRASSSARLMPRPA